MEVRILQKINKGVIYPCCGKQGIRKISVKNVPSIFLVKLRHRTCKHTPHFAKIDARFQGPTSNKIKVTIVDWLTKDEKPYNRR